MRVFPSDSSKPFARMVNVHMGFNDAVSKTFRCLLFFFKLSLLPYCSFFLKNAVFLDVQ